QVPFSSDTPFSVIPDHIYSPLPLPHLINPSVPDEVERVLLKALAKERDDRFIDVDTLTQAFKQAWDDSSVDMDEVTMTAPLQRPAKTIKAMQAQALASDAPTIPPAAAQVASAPPTMPSAADKKKRAVWPFIAGGILVLFACIFALSALNDGGLGDLDESSQLTATSQPVDRPMDMPAGTMRPGEHMDSQELTDARNWVIDSPGDPYAHLALALAFLDDQQRTPGFEQLRKSVELAGDDADFYYQAGFSLMDREIWTGAAAVFMQALRSIPPDDPAALDLAALFHENLYYASLKPEASNILPLEEIAAMDEPMAMIVEARYAFYKDDPNTAWALLEKANSLVPDMPEARLLEGEFSMLEDNMDVARNVFEALLNDGFVPDWIRAEAENYLNSMP
ncbi:MAG: hypothetical protein L3J16_06300, partial [Anaerolineales bacterium]|nr:hypothetical protein [Anaerolineales bacterium]